MSNNKDELDSILKITHELFQIQDLDILLEETLSTIRKIAHADAGSIYLVENGKLKFSYTQNDTLQKQLPPGKKMIYSTFTIPINNESIAGYAANTDSSINIEDVYQIDHKQPFTFNKKFDEISGYRTKSILTMPIKTARNKMIGVLQLINAKTPDNKRTKFSHKHELLVQHFANHIALTIERAQMTRTMIMRMVAMASLRDPKETGPHTQRVAAYSVEIYETWARKHNIAKKEIDHTRDILKTAALLHDVGKVAIPDSILKKPGHLTDEERKIMQDHTRQGADLFIDLSSELDDASKCIALNHHEKWDGTGYPGTNTGNKKGNEIPLLGQIVSIADVYDALNSRRCYKEPFEESKVLEIIKSESGKQFNPEIVDAFFECIDTLRLLASRYPEELGK